MPEFSRYRSQETSESQDTQELAAVQGAGELCFVTDGVLVVPCLRSIIRANDTDEWAGALVESAKPDCKASAGICNYAQWTVVMTAQTVRREWLFEPLILTLILSYKL